MLAKVFSKGKGFAEAEAMASEGIASDDVEVRKNAFAIFKILFEGEHGYRIAMRHPIVYMRFRSCYSY